MANFEAAYRITMKNEGGYCNTHGDSGGETWRGIARNYHTDWDGWHLVDNIKAQHPSSLNVALAANGRLETMVLSFYKKDFWDCLSLDRVNCQQIANQMFDIAVNMGCKPAAAFLQQSINKYTNNSLLVDGHIGPVTIATLNGLKDKDVYDEINTLRAARYNAIIAHNPSQAKFRHSWFSRITPFAESATTGNMA